METPPTTPLGDFVDAALQAHQVGRHEVSLALATLVVDATAKKNYPDLIGPGKNKKRIERFLNENFGHILAVGYLGFAFPHKMEGNLSIALSSEPNPSTLEAAIYKWVRCPLVHECCFSDEASLEDLEESTDGSKFPVPKTLSLGLLVSSIVAQVNAGEKSLDTSVLLFGQESVPVNELWGTPERIPYKNPLSGQRLSPTP